MKRFVIRLSCWFALAAVIAALAPRELQAAGPVGFLLDTPADRLGPEARAAWELAGRLGPSARVVTSSEGRFRDENGREVSLDSFPVLWFHQGDSGTATGPAYSPITIVKLRRYVSEGHGLLLSGAALGMVRQLGLEPFSPRRAGSGVGFFLAGLVPIDAGHPAFQGLSGSTGWGQSTFLCNDSGHAAFSDFQGKRALSGMVLAHANSSSENPLVEYELGKGRVIVLGWRVPRYAYPSNPHRANLERLTGNLLGYLGAESSWRKVVVRNDPAAPADAPPGVSEARWTSLELAIRDLTMTFKERYQKGPEFLARLSALKTEHDALRKGPLDKDHVAGLDRVAAAFDALKAVALLANPLVDFDRLLYVERGEDNLGLPANWESNSSLKPTGFDNRLRVLSPVRPGGKSTTLFEPPGGRFVGDVELHWNADRMLLSMPGSNGRWQVHELGVDGKGLREIPLIHEPDVDNYDACYLPDGRIIFTSTAPFVGVPCVYGSSHVTNLYVRGHDGSIRQLTVDQEHNWCPTVLPSGRVLYLRWEYTDLPHSNSRRLFQMNPDGTGQMEYLSSGSYFPNSFFYARPIPGHATKVVGIATGHHGNARVGRLLIMDPARGRREAEGVVQEIPGHGKTVEAIIRDPLADGVWPQFLHPFPLGENYFLVSMRPGPEASWGIYLVDVFDNTLLLAEKPGYALLEPVPVKKWPTPPTIPDRVDTKRDDALVFMSDVYQGVGVRGVPRGAVKKLRLVTYHFSYQGMGGLLGAIGMDGPWDIKQVLGTVPVEPDGSALFRVPAYTPISVQPLDAEGKALQIMRSWFTAMPGEVVSCVGCHETQNSVPASHATLAAGRSPSDITPWRGPTRGFSFAREVQPVIDRQCVGCHDGRPHHGQTLADLRGDRIIADWSTQIAGNVGTAVGGKFSPAYAELHRFVRRPGIEDDIHPLAPLEYHADSTELVQMLRKGHHGVRLDDEGWDRLVTWIDLNAPYHGTWREIVGDRAVDHVAARARAMRKLYTGRDEDPEQLPSPGRAPAPATTRIDSSGAATSSDRPTAPAPAGWPFDGVEARRRQGSPETSHTKLDLGGGVALELVRIPAGELVMGSASGPVDERPPTPVRIARPFWMGRFEVTNAEFARFDPVHDSHVEPMHGYQFGIHGYPVNGPRQPVVRVSWDRAMAFCAWLSEKTGRRFSLPTEMQWEHACRAGTATPYSFGAAGADYSGWANLGDKRLREFALETYVQVHLIQNPNKYDDWVPRDDCFDDGGFVSVEVGKYRPNAWGLHDMHGNVWEWTRTALRPYPYRDDDGRNNPAAAGPRVVRGGSWYDRPQRATSSYRLAYRPYQGVFNVGFRVVIDAE
jgi:formylglycine-generating enzyme required for sulfatase activity